jgi:DMATS type aromatic prenyltransferase
MVSNVLTQNFTKRGTRSFADHGVERLRSLCDSLGFDAKDQQEAIDVFLELLSPWGESPVGDRPRYASDISDDHTPFEFSIAIDRGKPELRFLVEAQASEPSLSANWEKARAVNAALEKRFGISLDRLRTIESFFAPLDRTARFGAWHAACLRKGSKPDFKIYLNPQAQGKKHAFVIVGATMSRLGFDDAYSLIAERAEDEIKYFSLDLAENAGARVKVYTAHHNACASDIETALAAARDYVPGEATEFCRAMTGTVGPFEDRPLITCLAFADGCSTPITGTIHVPVRSYAENDLVARDRIIGYLDDTSSALYENAVSAFASRPLEDGVGMQAYASLRQQGGKRRVTVYLGAEVYGVERPRISLAPMSVRGGPTSVAPVSGYQSRYPAGATHLRRIG